MKMLKPESEILACFSLGSNLGDRKKNLESAGKLMAARIGTVVGISRTYESPAWGYSSSNTYYNCCLILRTLLPPNEIMELALLTERELGRTRGEGEDGYTDRIIDIDLLLYGDAVMDQPGLSIPHPKMIHRRFVLVPLAEVAKDLVHPVAGLNIAALLEQCQDTTEVIPV